MLLLERDEQLAQLSRWHEASGTHAGCVVLVTGEAGIGKTAIVSEFIRRRGAAVRVLWGACDPLSTPQPLGPLSDVSRQVGGALLEAMTQGTNRDRIFAATVDQLERSGKPVVLVIEDMHWADDATLDLMKWAELQYGEDFMKFLVKRYHPLQIVFALATFHSIVLLNGSGFGAPDWSVRVSLANLPDAAYREIGADLAQVAQTALARWKAEG